MSSMLPRPEGLFDPSNDRDSCGVGFVADIQGRKTHDIVEKGLEVVINLTHRGAAGSDPRTGDGAGILMQLPDAFLRRECADGAHCPRQRGFTLPPAGEYGVGMVFLPQIPADRHFCMGLFEEIVEEEGLEFLGWRTVPVDESVIGEFAKDVVPRIKQIFVGMGRLVDREAFERKLFVVRKRVQRQVRASLPGSHQYFYVPSFSTRTIVYKGMLFASQMKGFYRDLSDPDLTSAIALVHQRYSTNTFPTWDLAHPFRLLAHNGEINTLRGNVNWAAARQQQLLSPLFGDDLRKILPIVRPMGSDSALLDNMLEFLFLSGRSLPHAMMMLIPEAWENDDLMDPDKKGFYEYHAAIQEPWDGPASIAFSDGRSIGAVLDRNGLRPSRYLITKNDLVVMASETGVLDIPEADVAAKGRLQPGKMFLIDTEAGRIIDDAELKASIARRRPYRQWVREQKIDLSELTAPPPVTATSRASLIERQQIFGYSVEDIKFILGPMAEKGLEPVGSMGTDTPLAVLSERPQLLYNYFRQMFAQITNPPIDPIREKMVMSTRLFVGGEGNMLEESPSLCHQIDLEHPILTDRQLEQIRHFSIRHFRTMTLPILYHAEEGGKRLRHALDELCQRASNAVKAGHSILILSDRSADAFRAPIPALLAVGAVHQHLIREGTRTKVGIMVESGEPREVHHMALLLGYGASAVNPYLAFESIRDLAERKLLAEDLTPDEAVDNYIHAVQKGLLKVMSKMGISTLLSYHGAQIFEALGIAQEVIDEFFTGTASRIGGIGLDVIAEEARLRHERAYPRDNVVHQSTLDVGGQYQWRREGERHLLSPDSIAKLQHAVRSGVWEKFEDYARHVSEEAQKFTTLRSLLRFKPGKPVPLDEVEPAKEIVKRFASGAMSYGSISREAHETLAVAMNRIGGRSNTGEGGEDPERFAAQPDGTLKRSSIKQVASGRFGVTTEYLINADELQIKIAQGAKPGEGGQLPGPKVSPEIARTRHSTPGVELISPPPHHDIYSIEDIKQLIFDLKNVNPSARISVKLVSETGVGTVAAGVSKAKADVILISGDSGGTGASPLSSIKHCGVPWEIGLSETHQVLVKNGLRGRVIIQTDGKLMTGRDVAIAALLGAEEYGFATLPLISLGCIMMRKCHLGTCPVGIATQDPELRAKFTGQPDHVVKFFFFIAEDLRRVMAELGFRTIEEMIGRVDRLEQIPDIEHWKAKHVDLSALLHRQRVPRSMATRCVEKQDHELETALDYRLLEKARPALEEKKTVRIDLPIRNVDRTVGAMLSGEIAHRYGDVGLPDGTITVRFTGSAGQSFGAWAARGLTLELEGDANDYVGKGLSGGRLVIKPSPAASFVAEENIIIGNVTLYGATSGELYVRGMAGERFAVRNSGALAVVEGVGDHGCEYMTGGRVVIIGPTGRNFAAGMSGGIAYVYDEKNVFRNFCNTEMVGLDVPEESDLKEIRWLLERHHRFTGSAVAARLIENWPKSFRFFVKVLPHDYRRAIERGVVQAVQHG